LTPLLGGSPTISPDAMCFIVGMMFLAQALKCGQKYHARIKCLTALVGTCMESRCSRTPKFGIPTRLPRNGLNSVSARLELRSRSNRHGHTLELACENERSVGIDASGRPPMSCCKTCDGTYLRQSERIAPSITHMAAVRERWL
jgi:hypothetical protein